MSGHALPPALVLAAGLGTRLRPLTGLRAKPALPVAGSTVLERTLRGLATAGITEVLVNLHHRPASVTAIAGDGAAFGLRVRYSWEQPLLGSGGGIARAFELTDAPELLVVNGDTLTDVDLHALVGDHQSSDALVTLAVVPHPEPGRYGGVHLGADGAVTGFSGRDRASAWHFVGAQVVRRTAFDGVSPHEPSESVSGRYLALLARPGQVRGWRTRAAFHDIGTPQDYLETCCAFAEHPAQLIGRGSEVASSARLTRTVLWDDVRVEAAAELQDCIVTDGVVVPSGSRYHRQIVLPAGQVPSGPADRMDGLLLLSPLPERAR